MDLWRPLHRIITSAFARNVAVLVSGTAFAHGLSALAAPVLSRLYDPAAFGLLALFTTVVSIAAEAGSWRYELAVVLPKRDENAANLLALSLLVVVLMSLLALLAVALAGDWFAARLGEPELSQYLWWVPPALLLIGPFRCLSYWATRRKQYHALSLAQVFRSLGVALVQVAAGFLHAGVAGLVGGRVAGEGSSLVAIGTQIRAEDRSAIRRYVSFARIIQLAREYADFPKYSLPQGLLNAVSQGFPALVLVFFYDASVVGLYAMAHRLLYLPSRFIGQSVRQVFLQKSSEVHAHGGSLFRLLAGTTLGLAGIGALPALVILLFGPLIFSTVLGSEWTWAGRYAQWMVVWLFFAFCNPPSTILTQVIRRQKILLVFDSLLFVCRMAALIVGGRYFSALTTVALFSVVGGVFNFGLIVLMLIISRGAVRPAETTGLDGPGGS